MRLVRGSARKPAFALAFAAASLSACREAEEAQALRDPPYCRYSVSGPMCDSFDRSAIPFAAELGLRGLDLLGDVDRRIVERHAATMAPRRRVLRVLAPIGPFPEARSPVPTDMPQSLSGHGNPRLAIVALGTEPGQADIHSFLLFEGRIFSTQLLAEGLRTATLRGQAHNGTFALGFSLADRPGSLGDRFSLRQGRPNLGPDAPVEARLANLHWERIGADTEARKINFFESIVNSGSCAGSSAALPLLLAPVPQAWLDEYARSCALHPDMAMLQRIGGRR
jgi:hypothetical protein